MTTQLKRLSHNLRFWGIDPKRFLTVVRERPNYVRDMKELRRQLNGDPSFPFGDSFPVLDDHKAKAGSMSGHYFHQDLLVAQRIFANKPQRHIDIGSRIDGFVTHVAVFREIEIFDIRPQHSKVPNIRFTQADLMRLDERLVDSCDSISSLHAIEHFGLGRYGDPIDSTGHLKALDNIHRMLRTGGRFYFSTPIGPQRIEFNAHRVFHVGYLLRHLTDRYDVHQFSYVDDEGDLHRDVALTPEGIASDFGCTFGCGIFELVKR